MLQQYVFIYLIGENEEENKTYKERIKSFIINAVVETYKNSLIAFNALRSDSVSGRQPDIILLDQHQVKKHGFNFLEEYKDAEFLDIKKTKLYLLSSPHSPLLDHLIIADPLMITTIPKPLTEEEIEKLIEY